MAELPRTRIWIARATFLALAFGILFVQFLPMQTVPKPWAPPDVLLALTLAWVIRRPDYLPVTVVAATFLLADLLLHRPPGLYAAMILVATEMLRARSREFRAATFATEWAAVAAAVLGLMVAYRIASAVVAVPQAPLLLALSQAMLTVAIYPVVALICQILFGISRPAPGAVDSLGHRL